MAINPLETLIENTSTISDNISPAKAAYILSQLLEKTGYDERTQNIVEEVSPDDQGDAIKTLSEIIGSINAGQSYEEAVITAFEVEELVEEVEQTVVLPLAEDRLTVTTDVIEEALTLAEEKVSINHSQTNVEDIHRYIIPIVLATLEKEGLTTKSEEDKDKYIRFESDKSILLLNISSEGEQHLIYDRKTSIENESPRALEATKESPEQKFEIIINNMTQSEIDRFKAIAQLEAKSAGRNLPVGSLRAQKKIQKVMPKTQQEELG